MPTPIAYFTDTLRKDRQRLHNFRISVGNRKDNREVNAALYNNITGVIDAINKLIADYTAATMPKKQAGRGGIPKLGRNPHGSRGVPHVAQQ